MSGGYHLMEFAKDRPIVHLEHKRSSLFLDDPRDAAPFVSGSETLRRVALDPLRSVEFAAALAAEYKR